MPAKTNIPDPIVVLNEQYQVALDPRCLILQKKLPITEEVESSNDKKKKSEFKILGYYSTWEHLGSSLVRDMTRDKAIAKQNKNEVIKIQDFVRAVNKSLDDVKKIFKQVDVDKNKIK